MMVELALFDATQCEPPRGIPPRRARDLTVEPCSVALARMLNARWHSRVPDTQRGPWQYAFRSHRDDVTYAVALWNSPSARMLPGQWCELRRMAVAPDAPHCTASHFLAGMVRWFRTNAPQHERLISYQDMDVHKGTIYAAAGWTATYESGRRTRDRSAPRAGTARAYRSNLNGDSVDSSPKRRWEMAL